MKILFVKLSAIGDVIHTLPALELLRAQYPESAITWVVEEKASGILLGHPHLDKVLVSKRTQWLANLIRKPTQWHATLREAIAFVRELRRETYDLIIDFQGLLKSAVLVALSKGRHKVGYDKTREGSYLVLTHKITPPPVDEHAVVKNKRLVRASLRLLAEAENGRERRDMHSRYRVTAGRLKNTLTAKERTAGYGVYPTGALEEERVHALLHSGGIDPAKPLVLVNALAGWQSKRWDERKTASLSDQLICSYDAQIVYSGCAADAAHINTIISRMQYPAVNAAGMTTLKELACLMQKSRLVISTDSGPMHLAAAVGTPVVAIFGPTAPWRTGPYTTQARIVRTQIPCSPCYRKRCDSMLCMRAISVDEVMRAAGEFLNAKSIVAGHSNRLL